MSTYHTADTPNGATITLHTDQLRDGELRLSLQSGNLTVRADLTEAEAHRLATALTGWYTANDGDVATDLTPRHAFRDSIPRDSKGWPL